MISAYESLLQIAQKVNKLETLYLQKLSSSNTAQQSSQNHQISELTQDGSVFFLRQRTYEEKMREIYIFLKALKGQSINDEEHEIYIESSLGCAFNCETRNSSSFYFFWLCQKK